MGSAELTELDEFRVEVMTYLAVRGIDAGITDTDGRHAVIVALDDERLAVLMRRIANVGGYANVFSRGPGVVRQVSVLPAVDALLSAEADDMVAEPPSGDVTVGAFLDYAQTQPNGVTIPALPPARDVRQIMRDAREVQFA